MHTTDISFPPELIAKSSDALRTPLVMIFVPISASTISRQETAFRPGFGIC